MRSLIDILIPLGKGSVHGNVELRYALRSIEKFATGYRRVIIVGEDPGFLSPHVVHYAGPELPFHKDSRIALKVLWAFDSAPITEEMLFSNDDWVFLKPTDVRNIPCYQKGKLEAAATRVPFRPYDKILVATADALAAAGLPTFHYDVHVPIRYSRDRFISLRPWWERSRDSATGWVVKSIYGNHLHREAPGPRIKECNFHRFISEQDFLTKVRARWVFSHRDKALSQGLLKVLEKMFPAKSKFEK